MPEEDTEQVSFDGKSSLSKHKDCQMIVEPGNHHSCSGPHSLALLWAPLGQKVLGAHTREYLEPTTPFQSKPWVPGSLELPVQMAQCLLPSPT